MSLMTNTVLCFFNFISHLYFLFSELIVQFFCWFFHWVVLLVVFLWPVQAHFKIRNKYCMISSTSFTTLFIYLTFRTTIYLKLIAVYDIMKSLCCCCCCCCFPVWTPNWWGMIHWKLNFWPIGLYCQFCNKSQNHVVFRTVSVLCLAVPCVSFPKYHTMLII